MTPRVFSSTPAAPSRSPSPPLYQGVDRVKTDELATAAGASTTQETVDKELASDMPGASSPTPLKDGEVMHPDMDYVFSLLSNKPLSQTLVGSVLHSELLASAAAAAALIPVDDTPLEAPFDDLRTLVQPGVRITPQGQGRVRLSWVFNSLDDEGHKTLELDKEQVRILLDCWRAGIPPTELTLIEIILHRAKALYEAIREKATPLLEASATRVLMEILELSILKLALIDEKSIAPDYAELSDQGLSKKRFLFSYQELMAELEGLEKLMREELVLPVVVQPAALRQTRRLQRVVEVKTQASSELVKEVTGFRNLLRLVLSFRGYPREISLITSIKWSNLLRLQGTYDVAAWQSGLDSCIFAMVVRAKYHMLCLDTRKNLSELRQLLAADFKAPRSTQEAFPLVAIFLERLGEILLTLQHFQNTFAIARRCLGSDLTPTAVICRLLGWTSEATLALSRRQLQMKVDAAQLDLGNSFYHHLSATNTGIRLVNPHRVKIYVADLLLFQIHLLIAIDEAKKRPQNRFSTGDTRIDQFLASMEKSVAPQERQEQMQPLLASLAKEFADYLFEKSEQSRTFRALTFAASTYRLIKQMSLKAPSPQAYNITYKLIEQHLHPLAPEQSLSILRAIQQQLLSADYSPLYWLNRTEELCAEYHAILFEHEVKDDTPLNQFCNQLEALIKIKELALSTLRKAEQSLLAASADVNEPSSQADQAASAAAASTEACFLPAPQDQAAVSSSSQESSSASEDENLEQARFQARLQTEGIAKPPAKAGRAAFESDEREKLAPQDLKRLQILLNNPRKALQLLKEHGLVVDRIRASHKQLESDDGRHTTYASHGKGRLGKRALASLMKQLRREDSSDPR